MGHSALSPNDLLFKLFYYFGFLVLFLIVVAAVAIIMDWLKERGESDGQNR
jgi:hypothetical protein